MPKKPSGTKRRRTRASTAVRTVTRHVRSGARRVAHKAGLLDGIHPVTAGLNFAAGYLLGPVLDQTGISSLLYNKVPGVQTLADAAYKASALSTGKALTKTAGVALVVHSLYESRNGGKMKAAVMNTELPFALGAILDDPTYGVSSGLPGSGGTQGYWVS